MILAALAEPAADAGRLNFHEFHGYIPLPWENHRLFGAGFLLVGVLLLVETLAGGVWFRRAWRRDLWPAVLLVLGWGLIAVALIDPNDRVIHSLMGVMMIMAGVSERRYRHGQATLAGANLFVAPALFAGGMEVGVFHSHGGMTSQAFLVHSLLGLTAMLMAPARLYIAREPRSPARHAVLIVLVFVLAFELLGLSHGQSIDSHPTAAYTS